MTIIATRIGTIPEFPTDYNSVAITSAECKKILESFSSGRSTGRWGLSDECDARDMSSDEVRKWLQQSAIYGSAWFVWIGFGEGVAIKFKDFVQYYDDLWFPGSDDLLIVSKDGQVAITLSHEEVFSRYQASKG